MGNDFLIRVRRPRRPLNVAHSSLEYFAERAIPARPTVAPVPSIEHAFVVRNESSFVLRPGAYLIPMLILLVRQACRVACRDVVIISGVSGLGFRRGFN